MHSWWKTQDFSKIESGPNYTTAAHAFEKAMLRLGLRAPFVARNYFFGYCFSVIIGLCFQILAVSQVPEDRHCLKRNTYTSFNLSSVIVNEIWRCQVFGKPKQPKKRLHMNVVPRSTGSTN